jgi:hypothetical protein
MSQIKFSAALLMVEPFLFIVRLLTPHDAPESAINTCAPRAGLAGNVIVNAPPLVSAKMP